MGLCSSAPEAPPNPVAVDLTHFNLLKVVGKGGFGKVNAIQRRQTNELMALKRMAKCEVIKKESHIRMVWTERDIMARLNSPFLVNLIHAFQDDKELYLTMPFLQGGDLRFHLAKLGCLSEEDARFYCAEILLGLEAMHTLNIVYRDLKPDNVLLDSDGHLRISDFGLSVELKEKNHFKIRGNAGTSGYLAPEVCTGEPYGLSCDVWTLGITVYELIHGRRPFKQWKPTDADPTASIRFGSNVSQECQDFIQGLLTINPAKRLGCGKTGWEEVKAHPWFAGMDWDAIKSRSLKAPIQPDPDAANCNNSADLADQLMDKEPETIPVAEQKHFENYEFRTDYKQYLEEMERDARLAGLNMSTATDVGPIGSTYTSHMNASHMNSHMIDDQPSLVVTGSPNLGSVKGGNTLTVRPAGTGPSPRTSWNASENGNHLLLPSPQPSPLPTPQHHHEPAEEKYLVEESKQDSNGQATGAVAPGPSPQSTPSPRRPATTSQPVSARGSKTDKTDMVFTRHHLVVHSNPPPGTEDLAPSA